MNEQNLKQQGTTQDIGERGVSPCPVPKGYSTEFNYSVYNRKSPQNMAKFVVNISVRF